MFSESPEKGSRPKTPKTFGLSCGRKDACGNVMLLLLAFSIRLQLKLGWFAKSSCFSTVTAQLLPSQTSRCFAVWEPGHSSKSTIWETRAWEILNTPPHLIMRQHSTSHGGLGWLGVFCFVFKQESVKKWNIRELHNCNFICCFGF